MEKLKNFLILKNIEDTQIYKELKCAKNEALILRELCRNYVVSISSINAFTLLSTIFGNDKYLYLDALEDLKKLIERGFVNQNSSFFKSLENNKTQTLTLALLQSELSLSEYFLEFLEAKPRLNFEKQEAYADYLEYLKDEFARIQLYERLSFIQKSAYNSEIKNQIKLYERHIKERLKKSKFYNVLADIFKEYNLEHKEQIIFLALLKEEYALSNESSISREMNSLLSLISENDLERHKNKKLLQENAPLLNLIECDEYLNAFGDISKSFFIIDEILQRIINFEPKQSKKIKIESVLKDQDIFELIEPSTDINDIIMPENTKELLENILKQQDKKVLERLHSWGIKSNKNIEAKIIFYGPAGTGKTMSALAMAKSMKKSVLSFDCSKILSKWVGESEQNVRKIFDTYKNIVQTCKQSPILLLNEADQFLSTRVDGSSGSDKMHNQMQNIFLEQIERFSGVIIATTNFLESLDSAFSRRFDYKIEFKKPDFKDRLKIWEKFLPKKALFEKDFDINILSNYELSGAQILMVVKNTALKVAVSKDGVFKIQDFIESIQKELNSSFDKSKIVGF
ncbi:ATP-binding protein [Campylobacter jejuni]|uniref:AAA family ATPase n=5 Tax=Campylobacter jejuni TaxID=197 RepID=Q0PBD3_CAMJE|nr:MULTISPECIES: ATP-binding protein [Campylobacter]YP_002343814.1 AAA ATPase [Campylobacter jejuni subsp. jejuni NCTC 11168 = ATCC 700819]AGV47265.1 ATPase AAA [Campylobacter jejuni subsp. jejuni 00-2544]AGV49029.1 ATPase AAA [Campylobacter jejuni subsp. jejuni 00-2538]AGV50692.1 ATPase AAA [Campylobacter jejuni subsp. jejuni 00-2426]AGV56211.1 ATPase AAA [Campylobacter jejuni subsp. jejuni 00-2425]AHK52808.1 ATPase AAA [Campylobacter jejuni subsp. jejuni NCTC 11168-K12E5]